MLPQETGSAGAPAARRRHVAKPQGWPFRALLVTGELSLTLGVVVLLFLGWYLFVNDAVVGSSQEAAARDIVREWAQDDPGDSVVEGELEEREAAVIPVIEAPAEGEEFALLYVPRFGKNYVRSIAEGVDLLTVLNDPSLGIGRYPESSSLGEVGNFAVAGHRTTFGAPFARIGELRVGDRLYVEVEDGWFIYRFRNLEYVMPTTIEVLDAFPHNPESSNSERILTLTSCHPRFSDAERIIAYAVLEQWQPRELGYPEEISHLAEGAV